MDVHLNVWHDVTQEPSCWKNIFHTLHSCNYTVITGKYFMTPQAMPKSSKFTFTNNMDTGLSLYAKSCKVKG